MAGYILRYYFHNENRGSRMRTAAEKSAFPNPALWASALFLLMDAPQAAILTLVDFNAGDGESTFGVPGWDKVLRDPVTTAFVAPSANPDHSGLVPVATAPAGSAYAGVSGPSGLDFRRGQRIIATFHNRGTAETFFRARVSFTDGDAALPHESGKSWYSMYRVSGDEYVKPGQSGRLEFYISDSAMVNAIGSVPAQGRHMLVNIGFISNSADVVLTKIELGDDADITPPTAPTGLRAEIHTSAGCAATVRLTWKASVDSGVGLSRYLIYRNGALHMTVPGPSVRYFLETRQDPYFIDLMAAPSSAYTYEVRAMDNAPFGMYPTSAHPRTRRGNESAPSNTASISVPSWSCDSLFNPYTNFRHEGAFRLPTSSQEYASWAYGGSGLTYYPGGNPGRSDTLSELPGSLYGFGHSHSMLVGEISIPRPSVAKGTAPLPRATQLKAFADPWPRVYPTDGGGALRAFPDGASGPDAGLAYHPAAKNVPEGLYYTLADGYATPADQPNLGSFSLALDKAQGPWFLQGPPPRNVDPSLSSRFAFTLPAAWADKHTGGRSLVVGSKYISGRNVPSQGTTLYAVAPWESGALPAASGVVSAVEMLRYPGGSDPARAQHNYFWDDDAEGAAFLSAGNKSGFWVAYRQTMGDNWYGDPHGQQNALYDLPEPRWASGKGTCASYRVAAFLAYDPAEIVAVIKGDKKTWEPQPYVMMDLTPFEATQTGMGGAGSLAWDAQGKRMYLMDPNGDPAGNGVPVIQVFQVSDGIVASAGKTPGLSGDVSGGLVTSRQGRMLRLQLPGGKSTLELFGYDGRRLIRETDLTGPGGFELQLPHAGLFYLRVRQDGTGGRARSIKVLSPD